MLLGHLNTLRLHHPLAIVFSSPLVFVRINQKNNNGCGMSVRSKVAELLALRDSVSESAVSIEKFTDEEAVRGK